MHDYGKLVRRYMMTFFQLTGVQRPPTTTNKMRAFIVTDIYDRSKVIYS